MKNRFTLCFVLLSSLLMARDQTNDVATDASKLIALENAWNQAELQHDPAALELILTDDFVITEPDGTMQTKREHMATTRDTSYHYDLLVSEDY